MSTNPVISRDYKHILMKQLDKIRKGVRNMHLARKVVFIMTDSQRKDMVGCYGNKKMHTPHLDTLASQGVRFEQAYCVQPVCQPARAGLFTGQYPHSTD